MYLTHPLLNDIFIKQISRYAGSRIGLAIQEGSWLQ